MNFVIDMVPRIRSMGNNQSMLGLLRIWNSLMEHSIAFLMRQALRGTTKQVDKMCQQELRNNIKRNQGNNKKLRGVLGIRVSCLIMFDSRHWG